MAHMWVEVVLCDGGLLALCCCGLVGALLWSGCPYGFPGTLYQAAALTMPRHHHAWNPQTQSVSTSDYLMQIAWCLSQKYYVYVSKCSDSCFAFGHTHTQVICEKVVKLLMSWLVFGWKLSDISSQRQSSAAGSGLQPAKAPSTHSYLSIVFVTLSLCRTDV